MNNKNNYLKDTIRIQVRFSEVDSLKIVWHGSYIKYLEDGREAFGRRYGIKYLDVYAVGYTMPLIEMELMFKGTATVDDILILETTYIPDRGAKIKYKYRICKEHDNSLVLEANTLQLFTTINGELETSKPEFLREWENQYITGKNAFN